MSYDPKEYEEELNRKVKEFDRKLLGILCNIAVSALTAIAIVTLATR